MKRNKLLAVAALAMLASPISWACSYDGQFTNPFSESYPGALDIAISTQQAIRSESIELPQYLEGQQGLRRASWWLQVMAKQSQGLPDVTYIYLVDSQLWSKYQAGKQVMVHVNKPTGEVPVLLLSEAALHNLVNNDLTIDTAKSLGIVVQS